MAGAAPLGSAEAAATAAAVFKKSRRLTSCAFSMVKTPPRDADYYANILHSRSADCTWVILKSRRRDGLVASRGRPQGLPLQEPGTRSGRPGVTTRVAPTCRPRVILMKEDGSAKLKRWTKFVAHSLLSLAALTPGAVSFAQSSPPSDEVTVESLKFTQAYGAIQKNFAEPVDPDA